MVYRERGEVEKIKLEHSRQEKPNYNLSLKPYFKTVPEKVINNTHNVLLGKEWTNNSNNVILGTGYTNVSIN